MSNNTTIKQSNLVPYFKKIVLTFVLFQLALAGSAQQVAEVITDFGGFWKSGVGSLNATFPNTSHNVLSFKYNTVTYSTGVDDNKLTANSIAYTPGDFRAFPVGYVSGVVTGGSSIYIALASRYDGVPNGYSNPLPSLRIKDVLTDGIHGLDLGTGATNIPAAALISFPINSVISSAIADAKPDILVSQIAQPTSIGDTLYFTNSSGVVVGNKLSINWTTISALGTWYLDLYSLPIGALCDTARISGSFDKETTRDIRLLAFKLSDFGITTVNAPDIANFVLRASGTSDPAFIAYNGDAFTIPAPVITVHPVTQVVCPNVSNIATFSVIATGGSLTYQWRKNNVDIPGATLNVYIIPNVVTASAGAYNCVVSNPVGMVISNTAYLNTTVAVQPSPSAQLIATGASCTLTISANNATGFQWRKSNVDILGQTSSTLIINPVNAADTASYSVRIINSGGGGCSNITSSVVIVTGSKTLYSKSSGNLNIASNWGVNVDGSGSSPVDFTRAEHTFIVKNNAVTGGNLTIAGTLDVANAVTTITTNTTLDVNRLIRSGTGSLAGSSTANITVRDTSNLFFQAGKDTLKNFTIHAGNITLLSNLSIAGGSASGTLTMNGGKLNTNDLLTLKSTATGTARMAAVTGGAIINGKLTIERFIPAARGWRYLSVPISASGAPTINQAWQEGATTASGTPNPNAGYGGYITGGTTLNGFDQSSTNFPSIKVFNSSMNTFVRLPATPGTNIPITSYPAYCVYFRGDRSINLMQGLSAAITSTTLRIKGNINTGDQAIPVNALNYTLVGNPYPSAINFATLTKGNVNNTAYIWDPKIAGNYGLGGYVTVSYNSSTGLYDKTTSVSAVSQYIPSGEAFFVTSADRITPGTITIKETDKTSLGSDLVFRSQDADQRVRVNLHSVDADDSTAFLDGILTTYADQNSNDLDNEDAKKMYGSNQSININRNGSMLSIERRRTIEENDTTLLNLYQMKPMDYLLEVVADNMSDGNYIAVLKDNYSDSINNRVLDMNGTNLIRFTVNGDPASYAVNRFSIVFEYLRVLPLSFTSVTARQDKKDILVEWKTENQLNITSYDVERSSDGRNFSFAASLAALQSNQLTHAYAWPEKNAEAGEHYYRIKSLGVNNDQHYSAVVKIIINKSLAVNNLSVFPNPLIDNNVSLQLNELAKGMYEIQVFNFGGQLLKKQVLQHGGGAFRYSFLLQSDLPAGTYRVHIVGDTERITTSFIKNK